MSDAALSPDAGGASEVASGFVVRQPAYHGDLSGLTRALRSGALAPRELSLLALVRDALGWFEREAERDLDLASAALPQLAQVVELKLRLLLPRPPRGGEDDEDEELDAEDALAAVALLEELEDAIAFLRRRRFERSVVVPARTPMRAPASPRKSLRLSRRMITVAPSMKTGIEKSTIPRRVTVSVAAPHSMSMRPDATASKRSAASTVTNTVSISASSRAPRRSISRPHSATV